MKIGRYTTYPVRRFIDIGWHNRFDVAEDDPFKAVYTKVGFWIEIRSHGWIFFLWDEDWADWECG
jgi:hypothetical protein